MKTRLNNHFNDDDYYDDDDDANEENDVICIEYIMKSLMKSFNDEVPISGSVCIDNTIINREEQLFVLIRAFITRYFLIRFVF